MTYCEADIPQSAPTNSQKNLKLSLFQKTSDFHNKKVQKD